MCFPCFLFHLVYCSTGCFFDRWSSYVSYFYLKHQSSSPQTCFRLDTSSRLRSMHLLLMICQELNYQVFFVRFRLFAMFRFHVIFLIWWITSRSSLPRNIYFDAGYSLSNRTDSRKNSATALFGLNIDIT